MKPGLLTLNVLRIAHVFVENSSTCVFTGYALTKRLNMDATTVWESLRKMEARGWLQSQLIEEPGRPKRLYAITPKGRESVTQHLTGIQLTTSRLARSA